MKMSDQQVEALEYFDERYSIIFKSELIADRKIKLSDPDTETKRVCRFCKQSAPQVTFKSKAHAVPEFLGNKALLSMNECDACNNFFAGKYETDLASWFGPWRTLCRMRGKVIPTYKDKEEGGDVRIEMKAGRLEISIVENDVEAALPKNGPFVFKIPAPTPTKPYIPINAAKALIKIACSLCPPDHLSEVQPAIDWLMNRAGAKFTMFPVLMAFTPGQNPYRDGQVLLLRRKVDEDIPTLWCIVATYNFRFQFFVPFCPSDPWGASGKINLTSMHFPVPFGENWTHGETKFGVEDWSGTERIVRNVSFGMHVDSVEEVPLTQKPDSANGSA